MVFNARQARHTEPVAETNPGKLTMKIRIHDDSVRLRLDRGEVDTIAAGNPVVCRTRFPGGAEFCYQLIVGDADAVTASFSGGCISVMLPAATAQHWATVESEVSIRAAMALDAGELSLLIEKDFECLEPREGEDQSNRFVNPKAATTS